jgi:hypothetical protein
MFLFNRQTAVCGLAVMLPLVSVSRSPAQDSLTRFAPERGWVYPVRGVPFPLRPRLDRIYFAVDPGQTDPLSLVGLAPEAELARFETAAGLVPIVVQASARDAFELLATTASYVSVQGIRASGPVFEAEGQDLIIADEIVIQFRQGMSRDDIHAVLHEYGLQELHEYPEGSGRVLVGGARETLDVNAALYMDDRVDYSSPNFYYQSQPQSQACSFPSAGWGGATTCDPNLTPPAGYDVFSNSQWQWDVCCVWQAWALGGEAARGSPLVQVAIADLGIDIDHEDLQANFAGGKNFLNPGNIPDNHHGSSVAGILVADDNGLGVMGVAPDCKLLWTKVASNIANSAHDISNLYWAANKGARVFNISHPIYMENDDLLRAVRKVADEGAKNRGMVITVAAGNLSASQTQRQVPAYFLASHPLVLAVSGSHNVEAQNGSISEMRDCTSAYGEAVDLVVPNLKTTAGGATLAWTTVSSDNEYVCLTDPSNAGTSWCAPFAGGVAALLVSRDQSLRRDEVYQILFHTTETEFSLSSCSALEPPVEAIDIVTGRSPQFGHGRVNAQRAVEAVLAGRRWPEPVSGLHLEPEKSGLALVHRLSWTNPGRHYTAVLVLKSLQADQRLLFRPEDGQTYSAGQLVAGGAGKVLFAGDATSFVDSESSPSGVRHYTVFAYKDNLETVGGQQVTVKRYSFGKEAKIRKGTLYFLNAFSSSLSLLLQNNALRGGDLIWVQDLTYTLSSPVDWTTSDQGSAEEGDVYLAGQSVPGSSSGPVFTPAAGFTGAAALRLAAAHVTIRHIGFRDFSSAGTAAIEVLPSGNETRLISNRFERCAVGIRLGQAGGPGHTGNLLVQNCLLLNSACMARPARSRRPVGSAASTASSTTPSSWPWGRECGSISPR